MSENTVLTEEQKDAIYNTWRDKGDDVSYGDLINDVEAAVLSSQATVESAQDDCPYPFLPNGYEIESEPPYGYRAVCNSKAGDWLSTRQAATACAWAMSASQSAQVGESVKFNATEEMIDAALEVDWSNEDERAAAHNVWNAMCGAMPSAQVGDVVAPEGYKLVPIKATREMIQAAYDRANDGTTYFHYKTWDTMLAAAPTQSMKDE